MAKIIVVEDDFSQQELLVTYLQVAGHEAVGVGNGIELDLCLEQFTPEVVLLDYLLPGENGAQLADRLRETFGLSIGIVMVTTQDSLSDRVTCRLAGADEYLVKPVDINEMLIVINNLLPRLKKSNSNLSPWKLIPEHCCLQPPQGEPIALLESEVIILSTLATEPQNKASREKLTVALGKNPLYYKDRALEVGISRLRSKLPELEDGRSPLQVIRGYGYHFIRPLKVTY